MSGGLIKTKDPRIKRRGKFYYARFMVKKIQINESLKTRSFEIAKAATDDIERRILAGEDLSKTALSLIDEDYLLFLEAKATGNKTKKVRENTLKEYVQFGNRYFIPHLKGVATKQITETTWEDLVKEVRKEKPEILFFNMRKYFRGFLSWAKRKGKIDEIPYMFDPDEATKEAREEAKKINIYTPDQLSRLREAAKSHDKYSVFMKVAQYMGMRPHEITQLKRDRIDWAARVIRLKGADTKTRKARLVPIHPEVEADLRALVGSHDSAYIFPNKNDSSRPMDRTGFKKVWKKILAQAEVEGIQYDFRKTFITNALLAGISPFLVAKITGSSLAVIEKCYLELKPEDLTGEIGKLIL